MQEPDLIVSALFMRIFYKKLEHDQYIAPSFLYPTAEYWTNTAPKMVYGQRKFISVLPLECDASLLVDRGHEKYTVSMKEMARDLRRIPFDQLQARSQMFKSSWDHVMTFTDGERMQAGVTEDEFNYLYSAIGPGAWCAEVLIKD